MPLLNFILNTFVVKLFLAVLRFMLNVALARYLGPELRGLYYVLQNIVGFIASFSSASIGEAYIYYHGKKKLSLISIKILNILVITLGAIFATLCLSLIFYTSLNETLDAAIYFWPSLILCVFLIYEYLILQELKARLKIYRANIYYAFSKLFLLLIVLQNGTALEPVDVIIYNIYAVIVLLISLLVHAIYYGEFRQWEGLSAVREDFSRWRDYARFSLKAHFGTILNLAEYRVDAIIAAYIVDIRLLGIYSVVLSIGQINYYIINSVNTVLFPSIVRGNVDIPGFLQVVRLSLLPVFLITILLVLVTDSVDHYIFGAEYAEVGKYFIWMAPVIILESFNRLLATLLKSSNALGVFNRIAIISILVYLPMLAILGSYFGLYGLIIASFISYFVRAIMYSRWMKSIHPEYVKLKYFIPNIHEFITLVKKR